MGIGKGNEMVRPMRLELMTFGLRDRCSNPTELRAHKKFNGSVLAALTARVSSFAAHDPRFVRADFR